MAKPQKPEKKEEKRASKKEEPLYKDWTALKSGVQRKGSWFVGGYTDGWFAWPLDSGKVLGPFRNETRAKQAAEQ